jgi:hypothetical protein
MKLFSELLEVKLAVLNEQLTLIPVFTPFAEGSLLPDQPWWPAANN